MMRTLSTLGVGAALLLWAGRAPERPIVVVVGAVLAAAPVALGVALTASRTAIMDGGSMRDLEGLRLLLAAGARPRPDDLGREESLIEVVAGATSDRAPIVLEQLLTDVSSVHGGRESASSAYTRRTRVLLSRALGPTVLDVGAELTRA